MANIQRAIRTITDDSAKAVQQAYKARPAGKIGPVTIDELPVDVATRVVENVEKVAPRSVREKLKGKLANNKYKLAAGGVITGGAVLAASDPDFIDIILSLAPDAIEQLMSDLSSDDSDEGYQTGVAVQTIGDARYQHEITQFDSSGHERMRPLDRTIQGGLAISMSDVERLQALTEIFEVAVAGVGSHDALEALIFLSNNTTPEDRQALMDNLRFRRGY